MIIVHSWITVPVWLPYNRETSRH